MSIQHEYLPGGKRDPAGAAMRQRGYASVVNKLSGRRCLCRLLKPATGDTVFINVCRMSAGTGACPYEATVN